MKLFKRHIDKSRDQAKLPEEFAWGNMQSDIYNKMSDRNLNKIHSANKFMTILLMSTAVLLTWIIVCSVFEIGSGNGNAENGSAESNLVETKIDNHKDVKIVAEVADYPKDQRPKLEALQTTALHGGVADAHMNKHMEETMNDNLSEGLTINNKLNKSKDEESLKFGTSINEGSIINDINKKATIDHLIEKAQSSDSNLKAKLNTSNYTNTTSYPEANNESKESLDTKLNLLNNKVEEINDKALNSNRTFSFTDLVKTSKTDVNPNNSGNGLSDPISSLSDHEDKSDLVSNLKMVIKDDGDKSLKLIEIPSLEVSDLTALKCAFPINSIPVYVITDVAKPSIGNRFTLGLGFGINSWGLNFTQLLDGSEKSSTEKSQLGTFGFIDLEYSFNDRFYLSTGLQSIKLTSRFNKVAIRNYTETHTNQLIEEETNPITGSVKKIYGDVELKVVETRRVQHFNSFDLISLPVIVGYRTNFGSVKPSIGLGLAYNISLKTNGKTEIDDNIIDYSDGIDTPYNATAGINPLMKLGVSYDLKSKFKLSLEGQYQHFLKQWNSGETFALKPRVFNIGLKIGKSF